MSNFAADLPQAYSFLADAAPPLPCHFAIAALQSADNSSWCFLMQACRFGVSLMTAAHNLFASAVQAARTYWGGVAASVRDVIAGTRTTECRPMPSTSIVFIGSIHRIERAFAANDAAHNPTTGPQSASLITSTKSPLRPEEDHLRSNSGSFAMFAAILLASSLLSGLAAARGSSK